MAAGGLDLSASPWSTEELASASAAGVNTPGVISPLLTTVPFGYNWTHPTSPLTHPWRFFSAEDLGANPAGVNSAALSSFREFESGGYVAVVLPFLSTTYLPEQRGSHEHVTDFRQYSITRRSDVVPGATPEGRGVPRYLCVRLSWNGEHIHQLCDPNDPSTGAQSPQISPIS